MGQINPRKFLCEPLLEYLKDLFPHSVGALVLISGFIIIVFRSRGDMTASWKKTPFTIGHLRVGFSVMGFSATLCGITSGHPVTDSPDDLKSAAALGLKLKLPGGLKCITVPTHAFVDLRTTQNPIYLWITDWLARAKSSLSRFAPVKTEPDLPTVIKEPRGNSPLGKQVWIAGTSDRVCGRSAF
jgi:hypothetical protein